MREFDHDADDVHDCDVDAFNPFTTLSPLAPILFEINTPFLDDTCPLGSLLVMGQSELLSSHPISD